MKRRTYHRHYSFSVWCFLLIGLVWTISGCVVSREQGASLPLVRQNKVLERANQQLAKELEQQKQLTAQLQMCLLGKYAELDRLTASQEHFSREPVVGKTVLWNRGDKVETVRFVAEVTTVIETLKEKQLSERRTDSLRQAEEYLDRSKAALDEGDLDEASYLAGRALKQVQTVQLELVADEQLRNDIVISFATPLLMTLLKTSNVREAPSMAGKVKAVLERGTHVTALGYKGQWVEVRLGEGDKGWVHYSLLSGVL